MKLKLNEKTLNAYINEAIKQELSENTKVDFQKLGEPGERKNRWWTRWSNLSLERAKDRLERGSFNSLGGYKEVMKVLRDLGYSPEQIKSGINNGAIRTGRLLSTGEFTDFDGTRKHNRRYGQLKTAAGMRDGGNVTGSTENNTDAQETKKATYYPWDSLTMEDITAAEEKQKQERAEAWRRRNLEKSKAAQKMLQSQPETQPQQNAPAQPEAQAPARQEMPKISAPTQPSQVPAARVEYTPEKIKPAGNQSYVQSAIAQMTKAAQAGNNELKNKIGQTAINVINKYQPKNQQTQNDLSAIKNAMANTLNEEALETDPEFAQDPLSVKKFQVWFNNTYGGQLVIDGKFGPKTRAAFKHWETYGAKNENKQHVRPTINEQTFKKLVKQLIAEEYMKRKR